MQKAAKACAAATHEIADALDRGKALDQLADGDPRLHPSQRHSRASVNAEAECQIAVRRPADVQTVGIVELRRVAIGSRNAKMDVAAGRNGDAAQRGVA